MDVVSLFTNIPHDEGVDCVDAFLKLYPSDILDSVAVITLLKLVLNYNNFTFDNNHFLQIHGAAMGSRVSPNYANLFMGSFEEKALNGFDIRPLAFYRYIDDIFIIWPRNETSLKAFFAYFNSLHSSIKFTCSFSCQTVNFLDVTVSLKDGKLVTSLFKKPTDRRQYLRFDSYHPHSQKKNIPYGQFLRIKRICTDDRDFLKHAHDMSTDFLKRGYPPALVTDALHKTNLVDRESLLNHQRKIKLPN